MKSQAHKQRTAKEEPYTVLSCFENFEGHNIESEENDKYEWSHTREA